MIRTCTACGGDLVPFAVPDGLEQHAPDGTAAVLCSHCLRTDAAAEAPESSDFGSVADYFPRGDGGAATALLLGMLDSLALNRVAIEALADRAEREGADVLLTLDRIDGDATLDPHFDVGRRRAQVEQILD